MELILMVLPFYTKASVYLSMNWSDKNSLDVHEAQIIFKNHAHTHTDSDDWIIDTAYTVYQLLSYCGNKYRDLILDKSTHHLRIVDNMRTALGIRKYNV